MQTLNTEQYDSAKTTATGGYSILTKYIRIYKGNINSRDERHAAMLWPIEETDSGYKFITPASAGRSTLLTDFDPERNGSTFVRLSDAFTRITGSGESGISDLLRTNTLENLSKIYIQGMLSYVLDTAHKIDVFTRSPDLAARGWGDFKTYNEQVAQYTIALASSSEIMLAPTDDNYNVFTETEDGLIIEVFANSLAIMNCFARMDDKIRPIPGSCYIKYELVGDELYLRDFRVSQQYKNFLSLLLLTRDPAINDFVTTMLDLELADMDDNEIMVQLLSRTHPKEITYNLNYDVFSKYNGKRINEFPDTEWSFKELGLSRFTNICLLFPDSAITTEDLTGEALRANLTRLTANRQIQQALCRLLSFNDGHILECVIAEPNEKISEDWGCRPSSISLKDNGNYGVKISIVIAYEDKEEEFQGLTYTELDVEPARSVYGAGMFKGFVANPTTLRGFNQSITMRLRQHSLVAYSEEMQELFRPAETAPLKTLLTPNLRRP
ncbi:MAG: hypothetical protein JXR42_05155 [Gammaproteobacteria bacterium]|nr:hypothetical protein [Gammaproteobacteria bacterium]